MRTVFVTAGQIAALVLLAFLIGLSVNAVRDKNHINLRRCYIPPKLPAVRIAQSGPNQGTIADPNTTGDANDAGNSGGTVTDGGDTVGGNPNVEPNTGEPEFTEISLDDVVVVYQDEKALTRQYVFIDARNDEAFQAGHIPGAVQCDYYRIDHYIDDVLGQVLDAEKVIVYCNGADCEDSLYLCGELLNNHVPLEKIRLFKGGWEEWEANDLPVETGDVP
ncbi:MAG: rhodanese-like domain-containing protein [Phycisphaerae bacterium]|nr:rhodanese-like domain-containing protein [Phycisphaerae bacterium]